MATHSSLIFRLQNEPKPLHFASEMDDRRLRWVYPKVLPLAPVHELP